MDLFNLFALLTTLAAIFSGLNHRTLRLPTTIGPMVFALLFMRIGFELLIVRFDARFLLAGVLMIPLVLGARWLSVGLERVVTRLQRGASAG